MACDSEALPVKFLEIDDSGVAMFTIDNETEKDIASFKVEITYLSDDHRALKIDTVAYKVMPDDSKPFIESGGMTYIAQEVPEGATSATGKILSFETMN